jgi:single-stranded-DNA-specific exonuclease
VPLDANNRVLVAQGIRRIRAGRCTPGIQALLAVASKAASDLIAADLGFSVAPRLNAAGRIDDMSIGIQCLLADDPAEAERLAQALDTLNQERRSIEAKMQREALAAVRDPSPQDLNRKGLCLYDPSWHQGVVGLVAGRIKDRLRRPVIAFANAGEGQLRGSARSVPGIHIRDVLDAIAARQPDLISKFGGHAMAAGLSLERDKLEELSRAFDAEVARWAPHAVLADAVETDGELSISEIALDTAQALRAGGPWGQAFPEPTFDGVFQVAKARIVGERHLKMVVKVPHTRRNFDAIAFNHVQDEADAQKLPSGYMQLVYRLDINEYQGERRLQMLVDHVLPAAE